MKNTKKLGQIRIISEKEIPHIELKMDVDDDTAHKLARAGWLEIQHDKEALINYAFCKALREYVDANGAR